MSDTVVSAAWLADHLDEVRLIDVRDAWEFDGIGHLPGAVNVPFDSFRATEHAAESDDTGGEPSRGMLPDPDAFADLMGDAGVSREDHVVAYDDTHGVFAARLLVTLELFGHPPEKLHLLDGDFSAWQLERETTSESPDIEPTTYEVAVPEETPLVGLDEVEAAIDTEALIVDTREAWEYEEGHIPGAVRLDWQELVDEESRGLKPSDEIERLLDERGITRDRRVVLYCNTARRISHTYTVLRHLGYEDVAFYEGSLTEWERADMPLETV
ncbi:sulfurtransferase [Haloarculaceae archaeon H-GB2-1]|nr:sulfurtransferase [Haloarculaceae archaeon H-GB1-1]MEA5388931.1 sulfurtransferase [Haloarculaceae archaeon H-GB11]MEA5406987.1 sulfurtransferase [Haloarculaceae archaeon H-GB2-1]